MWSREPTSEGQTRRRQTTPVFFFTKNTSPLHSCLLFSSSNPKLPLLLPLFPPLPSLSLSHPPSLSLSLPPSLRFPPSLHTHLIRSVPFTIAPLERRACNTPVFPSAAALCTGLHSFQPAASTPVAYPGFQRGGCLRSGPIRKVGGGGGADTFVWHKENTLSLITNGYNFDQGCSSTSRVRANELNCCF